MGSELYYLMECRVNGEWKPCSTAGPILDISYTSREAWGRTWYTAETGEDVQDLLLSECSVNIDRNYPIYYCLMGWEGSRSDTHDKIFPVFPNRNTAESSSFAYRLLDECDRRYDQCITLEDMLRFLSENPYVIDGETGERIEFCNYYRKDLILNICDLMKATNFAPTEVRVIFRYE